MNFVDKVMAKWERFAVKARPVARKVTEKCQRFCEKVARGWKFVLKYKKHFLTIPVAGFAVIPALVSIIKLPAMVGIGMKANGDFAFELASPIVVLLCLLVTGFCLLLVLASKRTTTPWLVSVISLLLPLTILITNTFPG